MIIIAKKSVQPWLDPRGTSSHLWSHVPFDRVRQKIRVTCDHSPKLLHADFLQEFNALAQIVYVEGDRGYLVHHAPNIQTINGSVRVDG